MTQPRISDVVRGRIDFFSIDGLVDMLARARIKVDVTVSPMPERGAAALRLTGKRSVPVQPCGSATFSGRTTPRFKLMYIPVKEEEDGDLFKHCLESGFRRLLGQLQS